MLANTLAKYIDAGFPIIYINDFEEHKIDSVIEKLSDGRKIFEWNGVTGFTDFATKAPLDITSTSLAGTLQFLIESELDRNEPDGKIEGREPDGRMILVLKDCVSLLEDAQVIAQLKYIAEKISRGDYDCSVIIEALVRYIPKELEPYFTILEQDYMTTGDIRQVITEFLEVNGITGVRQELIDEMSIAFKGLSQFEIENILALAYADDGEITRGDLQLIFEQKRQMILKAGILEMVPLKESIEDIGGLENLKKWLAKKAKVITNIEKAAQFGVDMPKGLLIAGVPGCGKSLNAKAAAKLFEVPLLRLDMGRLLGKYVGESESNMRRAIALAEAIAPCVLWVDELEKAFAGISGDGGGAEVTTRLFGNFLTWMQEKESPVFVVATANDITKLPPELLRKGRFDEIFYVGLPNKSERKKIFEIHMGKRRKQDLPKLDLQKLVDATEGYSGADIEGVIRESIETAFAGDKKEVTTEEILAVIRNTHSLSEIMKEPIEKMSEEYKNRKFKNASAGN